jgi:hypothetical protein
MPTPQTYKNHARFDPLTHFVVFPILLLNVFVSIYVLIHHWADHPHMGIWLVVMSVALFLLGGVARSSALRAQDRIIRLEERLRYQALLPAGELAASQGLTTKQMIALRFASDAELPHLVHRALAENMTPKQIKQSITVWRPDYERV